VRNNIFKQLRRSVFAAKAPKVIMEEAMNDLERIYKKNDRLYIFGLNVYEKKEDIHCSCGSYRN